MRVQIPEVKRLQSLPHLALREPITVFLEPDDEGYIAQAKNLPLYGFGDSKDEAINALEHEIESLYRDLMEDDNFTADWLEIKAFLKDIVEE